MVEWAQDKTAFRPAGNSNVPPNDAIKPRRRLSKTPRLPQGRDPRPAGSGGATAPVFIDVNPVSGPHPRASEIPGRAPVERIGAYSSAEPSN